MERRLDSSSKTINESLSKQTEQMLNAQRAIYSKLQESAKSIGEMSGDTAVCRNACRASRIGRDYRISECDDRDLRHYGRNSL